MRKVIKLVCPDCDTPLPVESRNKRTGKLKYRTGSYPCVECNTSLIVTEVAGKFHIRVRQLPKSFHHPKPSSTPIAGVEIDYHPDWLPDKQPEEAPLELVCCVGCNITVESAVNTVRARLFVGFLEKLKDGPIDPTTGEPRQEMIYIPNFKIGRLCRSCIDRLTGVSGRPPKKGEFEYLHERISLRKRRVVTVGSMKSFDIAKQRERDMEDKRYVDLGDVRVRAEDLEDSTLQKFEEVDVAAYRAFNRMGGKRRYDPDMNKDNSRMIK